MVPLFLGLSAANIILLSIVFAVGLGVTDSAGEVTSMYRFHLPLGLAAGLMVLLAHLSVFVYFMATSKWLLAATDKAGLPQERFAVPAFSNKRIAFFLAMGAIVLTMITMFAGAGADPFFGRLWPANVHLALALITLFANIGIAFGEYHYIRAQGLLMDKAITIVSQRQPEPAV